MYETFYGFENRAFPPVPDSNHFYPVEELVAARETLSRVIQQGEGPGLVVGPAGVGKTLLSTLLADQFRNDFHVVTLACGQLRQLRDMLQSILHQLRLPYRKLDEGELRLTLLDFLEPSEECLQGMLLLVDEAQHLSIELLEEVRMISNFVRNGSARVRAVLLGNDRLEELFTNPQLESLNQRLAARCYLQGMGREETRQYIIGLTNAAGGNLGLWGEDALRAIYDASDGIPRIANQVANLSLTLGAQQEAQQVGAKMVEQAWAEQQQLPTPWNGDSEPAPADQAVIEFGGLDDEPLDAEWETAIDVATEKAMPEGTVEFGENPIEDEFQLGCAIDLDLGEGSVEESLENTDSTETLSDSTPPTSSEPTIDESGPIVIDDGDWDDMVVAHFDSTQIDLGSAVDETPYELTPAAAEQAEQIESRLAKVETNCGATEPPSAPPSEETEEIASNPFGTFSEEEVILDQDLSLGQLQCTIGPRVTSRESRLLSETLDMHVEGLSNAVNEPPLLLQSMESLDPPVDDYDPPTVVPIFAASHDDRDIIVIDDEKAPDSDHRAIMDRLRGT